jgi:hypothetical protein
MLLATKTLAAIEAAMQKDRGATFRKHLRALMPLAEDAYNEKDDPWRNHLGASLIGRECARELWYSFHWATLKKFDGRMLRLFNRGHLEEPRFVAMLLMIGCQVWQVDANGKQFRVTGHKGHFGGSMDGVVFDIPDLPGISILTEFKTHGDKSFTKLKADGVMAAKWEHFVQMQIYMGKNNLPWALYAAVNKNDDALHLELVQFDPAQYQRYLDRSAMIIDNQDPPPKINESPGWFKCKFCDYRNVCHGGEAPARNCRTCMWSRPIDGGEWVCESEDTTPLYTLSPEKQREGCPSWVPHRCFIK